MAVANGIFIFHTGGGGAGNEDVILYHMNRYGIDMTVSKNTSGRIANQKNADLVKRLPDRFVACCNDEQTQMRSRNGEKPWNIEDCVNELDGWLATGQFVGIGEGIPRERTMNKAPLSWEERRDQICQLFELGRKYKVPMHWHTGIPIGSAGSYDLAWARAHADTADNGNPLLCHEIAQRFPDVPIVMTHAGIEASGYFMEDYERCLNVASSHHNVFLETGMWWAELYAKALKDPNIGAKKLVWGCGWGQPNVYQTWMPGEVPETYNAAQIDLPPIKYTPDVFGWSLRELGRLNIPQDDLNLILGGNAAFLYKVKTPLPYEKMFKPVERRFWN